MYLNVFLLSIVKTHLIRALLLFYTSFLFYHYFHISIDFKEKRNLKQKEFILF